MPLASPVQLIDNPPNSVDEFTDAVLIADGDGVYSLSRNQVRQRVAACFEAMNELPPHS